MKMLSYGRLWYLFIAFIVYSQDFDCFTFAFTGQRRSSFRRFPLESVNCQNFLLKTVGYFLLLSPRFGTQNFPTINPVAKQMLEITSLPFYYLLVFIGRQKKWFTIFEKHLSGSGRHRQGHNLNSYYCFYFPRNCNRLDLFK